MTEEEPISAPVSESVESPFYYLRYFDGHRGRYGHEFLEFEIKEDGMLRYANNSNYRSEDIIKKQARLSPEVLEIIKMLLIKHSVCEIDDALFPDPDRNGRQELEVKLGNTHVSFLTNKLTTFSDVEAAADPGKGLIQYYSFIKDIKNLVLDLVSVHFKIKAV